MNITREILVTAGICIALAASFAALLIHPTYTLVQEWEYHSRRGTLIRRLIASLLLLIIVLSALTIGLDDHYTLAS